MPKDDCRLEWTNDPFGRHNQIPFYSKHISTCVYPPYHNTSIISCSRVIYNSERLSGGRTIYKWGGERGLTLTHL
jgi:hypothetical protein